MLLEKGLRRLHALETAIVLVSHNPPVSPFTDDLGAGNEGTESLLRARGSCNDVVLRAESRGSPESALGHEATSGLESFLIGLTARHTFCIG